MLVKDNSYCFVCGQDNSTGLKAEFELDTENRKASSMLTIPSRFQGWDGIVHGGVIGSLLDEVSIYACRSIADKVVTAELSVKYKKPVPVDTSIMVSAQVVEAKRKVLKVRSVLEVGGVAHAEAEARIFIVS